MEPLVVEIDIAVSRDHAFMVWTENVGAWWPASHRITDTSDVIVEPFEGGRIFERAPDGTEHDWGEVVTWEPPQRLQCLWHLFFDRSEATDLEVRFEETESGTKVVIRQSGWERLGAAGADRRSRTHAAWSTIGNRYRMSFEQAPMT